MPRRILLANRKGHAVNTTFVDDVAKRIHLTPCSFVFAPRRHRFHSATPLLRHRVTRKACFPNNRRYQWSRRPPELFISLIDLD
jgi:hypothetical protein